MHYACWDDRGHQQNAHLIRLAAVSDAVAMSMATPGKLEFDKNTNRWRPMQSDGRRYGKGGGEWSAWRAND